MFCVSLPLDSWQFHKQLMVKSETCNGFKSSGNHQYIKRNVNSNEQKCQKEKKVFSPSLFYLHGLTSFS